MEPMLLLLLLCRGMVGRLVDWFLSDKQLTKGLT